PDPRHGRTGSRKRGARRTLWRRRWKRNLRDRRRERCCAEVARWHGVDAARGGGGTAMLGVGYGNGLFMAAGDNDPPHSTVPTSTDGVHWVDLSLQAAQHLR